jgi:hypothetical protein
MIVSLVHCLHGAGFEWALFTLLPSARNTFARLGLRLIPLAEARPDRLPAAQRAAWGRYYEQRPWVMAGKLADGIRDLDARTPACLPSPPCHPFRFAHAWA